MRRHPLRRLGAQRPAASRSSALQRLEASSQPGCTRCASSGIWECFVPGVGAGALYKYAIISQYNNYRVDKADPYAFAGEIRPETASKVWDLSGYDWGDDDWMARRGAANAPERAHRHL